MRGRDTFTGLLVLFCGSSLFAQSVSTQPASAPAGGNTVVIRWPDAKPDGKPGAPDRFTARFVPESLVGFLRDNPNRLPLPMQPQSEQERIVAALQRIDMDALLDAVGPSLDRILGARLDLKSGLIVEPLPADKQITIALDDIKQKPYVGPKQQVTGLVVNEVTENEYVIISLEMMEKARQLLQTGDPLYDRTHPDHLKAVAKHDVDRIRANFEADQATAKDKEEARRRVGELLEIYDAKTGKVEGEPRWVKESRRFSYGVTPKKGKFIDRL